MGGNGAVPKGQLPIVDALGNLRIGPQRATSQNFSWAAFELVDVDGEGDFRTLCGYPYSEEDLDKDQRLLPDIDKMKTPIRSLFRGL